MPKSGEPRAAPEGRPQLLAAHALARVDSITTASTAVLSVHVSAAGIGRLTVSGTITLGGSLALVRDDGFAPNLGSVFTLLTAGQINGAFTGLDGTSAGGGNVFTLVSDETTISVEVTAA